MVKPLAPYLSERKPLKGPTVTKATANYWRVNSKEKGIFPNAGILGSCQLSEGWEEPLSVVGLCPDIL